MAEAYAHVQEFLAAGPCIVTLDGPAGVGKSTLAKHVAEALGIAYLDTGAMFRTIAMYLAKLDALHEDANRAGEAESSFETLLQGCIFTLEGSGAKTRLLCNGRLVGDEIRTEEAGMMAARAGRIPEVREFLKKAQQSLGEAFSLVAEGRDMGTVVFPQAGCKIFLDADVTVRAERRLLQLRQMGQEPDFDELKEQIRQRDEQDRNRSIAPLKPAEDAHIIDTSALGLEEVFAQIMRYVSEDYSSLLAEASVPDIPMRRKDRALTVEESFSLLERGVFGTLAVMDGSGWPYAIPLSYVVMDGRLYFHSAAKGRKVEALAACDKVSFSVVGDVEAVYTKDFTTWYESVMVFGRVSLVEDEQEKFRSLEELARKYLPEHMDKADQDIRRSISRTYVYRLVPELVTGKAKKPGPKIAG